MKYKLSSAKKPVAAQKPFDFQAAAEALAESLEHTRAAYDEYVAAEGRVIEVEGVLSDCAQALESISKFGIVAQNMALLNDGNGLDRALGLEDLAIDSLESLSASTKAMLQKQYCAGLENKVTEMLSNLVARVKDWFSKLMSWLKEFFSSNAKIAKMVDEAKFDNIDFDAKAAIIPADNCQKMLERMIEIQKAVGLSATKTATNYDDVTGGADTNNLDTLATKAQADEGGPSASREVKKLSDLGWDTGLSKVLNSYKTIMRPMEMDAAWKKVQDDYRAAISKTDEGALSKLQTKFKAWRTIAKLTSIYGRLYKKVGFALLTVSKHQKKADAAK